MRFYLLLIALFLVSDVALSTVIKETKQGQSIEFFTNETGTVEKKAEITSAGKLKVKEVTDLTGTGTPPGMVPIGGMVAVMPNTHANTWQPPATGVIKDGFMRANGHTITAQNVSDGSVLPEGTVLPNMVDSFARGAASSSIAPVGGLDNTTPTGTVSQPTFAGVAEARSAWFKSQGISATTPAHYHGFGTGSGMSTPSTTVLTYGSNEMPVRWGTAQGGTLYATWANHSNTDAGFSLYVPSMAVSGNVGLVTGGVNGNAAMSVSFNTANDNMIEWAAATSYTPTGTVSQPGFTGDSQTNMPVYNNVVWVIRVK